MENIVNKVLGLILVLVLAFVSGSCGLTGGGKKAESGNGDAVQTEGDGASASSDSSDSNDAFDSESKKPGSEKIVVRFDKGGTSKSYSNSVPAAATITYVINARKGQTMTVGISAVEGNALFTVKSPAGALLSDGEEGVAKFSKELTADGNYTVSVSPGAEKAKFEIRFDVVGGLKDDDEEEEGNGGITKTVKFSKGATSASYEGAVIRADRDTYVLGAGKGQTMSVSISALENNAVFQIKGPTGYLPGTEPGKDSRSFNGVLPADGKYQVIVGGTRGNATYKIRFSIK